MIASVKKTHLDIFGELKVDQKLRWLLYNCFPWKTSANYANYYANYPPHQYAILQWVLDAFWCTVHDGATQFDQVTHIVQQLFNNIFN